MNDEFELQPGKVLLSDHIHFRPTEAFLEWMFTTYPSYRSIVEVGAGMGHLSRLLGDNYNGVIAIDICDREAPECFVYMQDATKFEYVSRSVVIMARPSHSAWIDKTVKQAFLCDADCVLYIGLEKNYEDDLGELKNEFRIDHVLDGAGADGEHVWRITPLRRSAPEMKEFWLVQHDVGYVGTWYRPVGGEPGRERIENINGGYCYISKTSVILEKAQAMCFEDLDWTKTALLSPRSKSGWLAPDGHWWPCDSQLHDSVADLILHSDKRKLEQLGYMRVYVDNFYNTLYKPNETQIRKLRELGISEDKLTEKNCDCPTVPGEVWEVAKREAGWKPKYDGD